MRQIMNTTSKEETRVERHTRQAKALASYLYMKFHLVVNEAIGFPVVVSDVALAVEADNVTLKSVTDEVTTQRFGPGTYLLLKIDGSEFEELRGFNVFPLVKDNT